MYVFLHYYYNNLARWICRKESVLKHLIVVGSLRPQEISSHSDLFCHLYPPPNLWFIFCFFLVQFCLSWMFFLWMVQGVYPPPLPAPLSDPTTIKKCKKCFSFFYTQNIPWALMLIGGRGGVRGYLGLGWTPYKTISKLPKQKQFVSF